MQKAFREFYRFFLKKAANDDAAWEATKSEGAGRSPAKPGAAAEKRSAATPAVDDEDFAICLVPERIRIKSGYGDAKSKVRQFSAAPWSPHAHMMQPHADKHIPAI